MSRRRPTGTLAAGLAAGVGVLSALVSLYWLLVAGLLVHAEVLQAEGGADQRALLWHTYLWDPWFLVWGLLLGTAVWQSRGRGRSDPTREGDDDGS